ncbi:Cas4-domain exonuclease [Stenotrophomonas phage BUCT626]|uniref:Exonuclease n=1 Tax=Stenotrophomonas phage BUCT626 TaxID=2860376 RepID=A0AC61NA80_9CAUD|nr:Cas4-domain exonuclease [Stenotrophomonas phage BUCT626]QYC96782.1 putative exonuclease [Stenotrophomonas phage BUCT626]
MAIYIADKTLAAINHVMTADQGGSFREWEGKIMPHMDDAWRGSEEPFRSHMGASLIGGDCARAVWLSWHWVTRPKFDGRMLRLFNRGHMEEARFLAMLQAIGCHAANQDENGKQWRISGGGGHFGGSGDGKAFGLPDVNHGQVVLLEFKTHSEKSFNKLAGTGWSAYLEDLYAGKKGMFNGKGVREAKPQHYTQMQIYMRKMGYEVTLYAAVNKNTDEIYMELVLLNPEHADRYLDLAETLVRMEEAPKRISKNPGWFTCKWCDHQRVCHKLGGVPDRNCRTCKFASPIMGNGEWLCKKTGEVLPKEKQFIGCTEYIVNPLITD